MRIIAIIVILSFFFGSAAQGAAADTRMGQYWESDTFVARFMGSFGILSEREPSISKDEKEVLDNVASLMPEDPDAAVTLLSNAIKEDSSAALDFTLGNLRFQDGQFKAAASHYRTAIQKLPDFQRAHRNLGLSLFREGDFVASLESLVSALKLGDEDGDLYGLIGHLYLQEKRFISAETAYRKAMLFMPGELNWKAGVAECLLAQSRYREAVALFDELIELEGEDSRFLLAQADAFLGLERLRDAAANYEMVHRKGKAPVNALANLGDIYLNEGLPKQALRIYLDVLDNGSVPVARIIRAAEALFASDQGTAAISLSEKLVEESVRLDGAQLAQVKRLQALIAIEAGDVKNAKAILNESIERNPMDGKSLLLLAGQYRVGEEWALAEDLLKRAIALEAFEADAKVELAQCFVLQGRYSEALPLLRDSLVLNPRDNIREYLSKVEELTKINR